MTADHSDEAGTHRSSSASPASSDARKNSQATFYRTAYRELEEAFSKLGWTPDGLEDAGIEELLQPICATFYRHSRSVSKFRGGLLRMPNWAEALRQRFDAPLEPGVIVPDRLGLALLGHGSSGPVHMTWVTDAERRRAHAACSLCVRMPQYRHQLIVDLADTEYGVVHASTEWNFMTQPRALAPPGTVTFDSYHQALLRSSFTASDGGRPVRLFNQLQDGRYEYCGLHDVVFLGLSTTRKSNSWKFLLQASGLPPERNRSFEHTVHFAGRNIMRVDGLANVSFTALYQNVNRSQRLRCTVGGTARLHIRCHSERWGWIDLPAPERNPHSPLTYLQQANAELHVSRQADKEELVDDLSLGSECAVVQVENHPKVLDAIRGFGYVTQLFAPVWLPKDGLPVIQPQRLSIPVELGWCGSSGVGVRSLEPAKAGTYVGPYVGLVLAAGASGVLLAVDLNNKRHNFQTELRSGGWDYPLLIDAGTFGNAIRFCNHDSENPSAKLVALRYEREVREPDTIRGDLLPPAAEEEEEHSPAEPSIHRRHAWSWESGGESHGGGSRVFPVLTLFLVRDVSAGEEITFDYHADSSYWKDAGLASSSILKKRRTAN